MHRHAISLMWSNTNPRIRFAGTDGGQLSHKRRYWRLRPWMVTYCSKKRYYRCKYKQIPIFSWSSHYTLKYTKYFSLFSSTDRSNALLLWWHEIPFFTLVCFILSLLFPNFREKASSNIASLSTPAKFINNIVCLSVCIECINITTIFVFVNNFFFFSAFRSI